VRYFSKYKGLGNNGQHIDLDINPVVYSDVHKKEQMVLILQKLWLFLQRNISVKRIRTQSLNFIIEEK